MTLAFNISPAQLKDPAHPCVGAVQQRHSHFFTRDGQFGSKDFRATQVDDTGSAEIAALPRLRYLDVSNTRITGTGFKELAGLKNLRFLILNDSTLTDEGLKELGKLTELKILHMTDAKVGEVGLKELRGMTNLETLFAAGVPVTDSVLSSWNDASAVHSSSISKPSWS